MALRILVPLWVLGFMSSRIAHADYWIGDRGFVIPETGSWQEPLHLPRLPGASAWALVTVMVVAGLAFAAGLRTRLAGLIFAATLFWVAFADRMQAYTVSKLGPVLVLALCATPCGARTGVDAWLAGRRDPTRPRPTHTTWGNVRFFQALLVVFYAASGLCKARGDWLHRDDVLWTLIHDTYQTPVTLLFANHAPTWSWAILQWTTLVYEGLAPIWFALRWTRPFALGYGLAMHLMIGLMFGPVIWFSLLMMTVLAACFLPARRLEQALRWPVAGRAPAGGPGP
ncbi:MAG TPA: HTTM domain-containing protein [Kofleriaceae bacterium]|nr:HTTM domain-containing protein [Kofleriaceae bacterium]